MSFEYGFTANVHRPPGKNISISVVINEIGMATWDAQYGCFSNADDLEVGPPASKRFIAYSTDLVNVQVVTWLKEAIAHLVNCSPAEVVLSNFSWTPGRYH